MKHLGLHEFPQSADFNEASIQTGYVVDKLNIPLRRTVNDIEFGDIFSENNVIKFVDAESEINELLNLDNDDVIKSLLISEIAFDDMFNFEQSLESSSSFHSVIELDDTLTQVPLGASYPMTSSATPALHIHLNNHTEAVALNLALGEFIANNLPLRLNFIDTTNSQQWDMIVELNNIFIDEVHHTVDILPDSTDTFFNTVQHCDIVEIISFNFTNISTENVYRKLPYHYHDHHPLMLDLPSI